MAAPTLTNHNTAQPTRHTLPQGPLQNATDEASKFSSLGREQGLETHHHPSPTTHDHDCNAPNPPTFISTFSLRHSLAAAFFRV